MHTHTSAVTSSLVGFDNSIRSITGKTDAKVIQKIRDRAVTLYQDTQKAYQTAIKLYQTIDKADAGMAVAALAKRMFEKFWANIIRYYTLLCLSARTNTKSRSSTHGGGFCLCRRDL